MKARLIAVFAILALSAGAFTMTASASPRPHPVPMPTILLVHGAFADASSWDGVIRHLEADGYPVIAPANPLRDLYGDSAYISSVISSIPGPVILVGHSYGGEVITNAAIGHPNVKALVYIAAFAPAQGENGLGLVAKFPGSRLASALITRTYPLPDGTTGTDAYIAAADFHSVFAADVPAAVTSLMAITQRPIALAALEEPSGPPAWATIPSWFLVAEADQAIPPAAELFMAQRAHSHITEVNGASHAVLISHPDATANLIIEAATATS
jgi:pimeloyl-ACP methyl ester carboxylesterase